jgi:putative transposase
MREVKINSLFKDIVLKIIDYIFPSKLPKTKGRPPKFSNEVYLNNIFYVLKEGIGWEYIKGIDISGDNLRKIFKKWTDSNIFRISYNVLLDIYKEYKIYFNDLFIDGSNMKNYMGSELTGENYYDKFKLATKLSIITDDIGVPVSIHLQKCNVHDVKLVISNIKKLNIDTETTKYLIADKGYVSSELEKKLANSYKLTLITPKKKNNKGEKTSEFNKSKLKKRFIVEHTFSWMKHYTRLFRRKDKKISIYKSFVFMGACNIIAKKISEYIIE